MPAGISGASKPVRNAADAHAVLQACFDYHQAQYFDLGATPKYHVSRALLFAFGNVQAEGSRHRAGPLHGGILGDDRQKAAWIE